MLCLVAPGHLTRVNEGRYAGFEDGGLHRSFPGRRFTSTTYDPRFVDAYACLCVVWSPFSSRVRVCSARPWYKAAVAKPGELIHTEPYLDAFGLGWMISMAKEVRTGVAMKQKQVGGGGADMGMWLVRRCFTRMARVPQ